MENDGAAGRYGRLGGFVSRVTPTISSGVAYTTGDQIGGVQEIHSALASAGGAAILESLTIYDRSNQSQIMDIFFFSSLPAPESIDNGLILLTHADMLNCLGVVHVVASDYIAATASSQSVATVRNIKLVLKNSSAAVGGINSTSVWAVAVIRGTSTYNNVNALKFSYGLT